MGNAVAAMMDESETNREIKKQKIQTKTVQKRTGRITAIFKVNPIKTPRVVAMPFPPLNLKKIVQLCPTTTQTAKTIRCHIPVTGHDHQSFKNIKYQNKDPGALSENAKNIGRPHISGAMFANIHPLKKFSVNVGRRNGSNQVT
jgi:hypothetical protein